VCVAGYFLFKGDEMNAKDAFNEWWNKVSTTRLMGQFEIELYRGITKETARQIFEIGYDKAMEKKCVL
jgi:hypothetical protein